MRLLVCTVVALFLSGSPAWARQAWAEAANFEQALARIIDDVVPRSDTNGGPAWDDLGLGGGREVFWHLVSPREAKEDAIAALHRRRGWVRFVGGSGDVVLCGDVETVQVLALSIAALREGRGDLDAELARRGFTATLLREEIGRPSSLGEREETFERREPSRLIHRQWRVEAPGRRPAVLIADHGCTPPGTRHATMCRTRWALIFSPAADAPPAGALDACQSRQRYLY